MINGRQYTKHASELWTLQKKIYVLHAKLRLSLRLSAVSIEFCDKIRRKKMIESQQLILNSSVKIWKRKTSNFLTFFDGKIFSFTLFYTYFSFAIFFSEL